MQVGVHLLRRAHRQVLIPGFYDDVEPLSPAEERAFLDSGFSVETFNMIIRSRRCGETRPLEVMRRLWATPTF